MKNLILILIASYVLVACGGGSGGSSTGASTGGSSSSSINSNTGSTTDTTNSATPNQTTVPVPTYAASTVEADFFARVNEVRGAMGYGLLAQNAKLDTSARNHLNYVTPLDSLNGGPIDMSAPDPAHGNAPTIHFEDSKYAGFTGVDVGDRATAAKYAWSSVAENAVYSVGKGGRYAADTLLNSVYHRASVLDETWRELGVAAGADSKNTVIVEYGVPATKSAQTVPDDFISVYPAAGTTNVALNMGPEVPNPMPDYLPTFADFLTKTSSPIQLTLKKGHTLVVTSFTVTEQGQGTPVDARVLTKATDPNGLIESHQAYWLGKVPFKTKTVYNVSISATNNGVPFTRNFSITTQ